MFNPNAIGVGAHADGVAVKHLTLGRAKYNSAWRLAIPADPAVRSLKQAVEFARRSVELSPTSSYNVHTLGTVLFYDGDYVAAREQLLKAIQLQQAAEKRGTLDELPEALRKLPKEPNAARREFETSLGFRKAPPHESSLYFSVLAMTLWQLGEQEAARDILRLVADPPEGFSTDGPENRRLIQDARDLIRPAE